MKHILLIIFISLSPFLQAQKNESPNYRLTESNSIVDLNQIDVVQRIKEDSIEKMKGKRYATRFAVSTEVELTPNNSGNWKIEGDYKIWELVISSPNAISLSLIFKAFTLAENAEIYILNQRNERALGPFTAQSAFKNALSTAPVKGKKITIQYKVPNASESKGSLSLSHIAQGYRDIYQKAEAFIKKDFGSAGACNNNVECPEADSRQDQVQSVALIILGSGTRWCSGCMIGNTKKDSVPYYLTAFHCIDKNDDSDISATELADITTWSFHFNYNSPDCSPSSDGDLSQAISGASLVASHYNSDVALLKLSTTPLDSYNVFYAGWDNTTSIASSAFGIHHPSGDVKKISFENDPIINSPFEPINRWRVTGWDDGPTEGGSSGSPLFNPSGRVIGQLFGGSSSCGTLSDASPSNDWDEYGKFSTSWSTGSSDSEKLAPWLDPEGTDSTKINGYYTFDGIITPKIIEANTFDIYPNPSTSGEFILEVNLGTSNSTDEISLRIYNIYGQLIHDQIIENNQSIKIKPNVLEQGTYYVELNFGEMKEVKPLLIIK